MNLESETLVSVVPLLAILAVTTLSDLRVQRIPNGLSLGGAVVALVTQATLHGPNGFVAGTAGWLLCLISFLPFYVGGGMAAGDVKLMAMVGAFLGPIDGFFAVLCTMAVGGVLGLLYATIRTARAPDTRLSDAPGNMAAVAFRNAAALKIPYASAIAIGTTMSLWQPHQIVAAWSQGGWA